MRPMRRAIGGSEDSDAAAASAVGAALGLAEAEAGIGVTPHGSFSAFVVAEAAWHGEDALPWDKLAPLVEHEMAHLRRTIPYWNPQRP